MQIPLASQSYKLRSLPASAQRCLNLYPEQHPTGARGALTLNSVAGCKPFASLPTGPVRMMATLADTLYAVGGTTLYRVTQAGAVTAIPGTITGSGLVDVAETGTQLVMVAEPSGFIFDGAAVTPISDPDFAGAGSVTYMDGYAIFHTPNTGQFFLSSILDATAYDALDFASAESSPDKLVRAFVDHRELWLFGTHSVEIWVNTGAAAFPFERQPGSILERGCSAARSIAKLDNTVFWLGEDLVVYRAQGYAPQRVSTHAIEQALADAAPADIAAARALTWSQDGHAFYALTIPGLSTFVYDAATSAWHERASYERATWRASTIARAYGRIFVGDDTTGQIYELDPQTYSEGADPLVRLIDGPPIHAEGQRAFMHRLQIDMETGVGTTLAVVSKDNDPEVMLRFSDDAGRTWSNERMALAGRIGEYRKRVVFHRLGSFRERVIRVSVSDAVPVTFYGAFAEVTGGTL